MANSTKSLKIFNFMKHGTSYVHVSSDVSRGGGGEATSHTFS